MADWFRRRWATPEGAAAGAVWVVKRLQRLRRVWYWRVSPCCCAGPVVQLAALLAQTTGQALGQHSQEGLGKAELDMRIQPAYLREFVPKSQGRLFGQHGFLAMRSLIAHAMAAMRNCKGSGSMKTRSDCYLRLHQTSQKCRKIMTQSPLRISGPYGQALGAGI
jgi:hypothetical protein